MQCCIPQHSIDRPASELGVKFLLIEAARKMLPTKIYYIIANGQSDRRPTPTKYITASELGGNRGGEKNAQSRKKYGKM